MEREKLMEVFMKGAGIIPDGDAISFGNSIPYLIPAGVEAVMAEHIKEIDLLLAKLPPNSVQALELFCTRGFTMAEYQALFDLNIRERDFKLHPAIRSLWIETETQRRKLIYNLDKDNFDDYIRLLEKCFIRFNKNLLTFFFQANHSNKVSVQCAFTPYAYYRA